MKEIHFPDWPQRLAQAALPEGQKQSFAITLRWYLSFCRRGRGGVNVQSARDFIDWAQRAKQPEPWKLENWREAIRWFFREAQAAGATRQDTASTPHCAPSQATPSTAPLQTPPGAGLAETASAGGTAGRGRTPWKIAFLTAVRRRRYSYRTEQSYLGWLERFARFCRTEDLRSQGADAVKRFLDALALDRRLSASSQRQALNAVVFLLREVFGQELGDFSDYRRAKLRPRAPVWLTRSETDALLNALEARWALMTRVAVGGGLRLMELLRLRVKDVDLEQGIITVRAGKGDKDRFVPLAQVTVEPLRAHLQGVRQIFEGDRRRQLAGVWLPEGLERKYPRAGEEWPWFWLWPDDYPCIDPRSGVERRHHVPDWMFQRVIKEAARRAGLNKRVTPHVLRHSFASQLLDRGTDIRTVQELLGHKSVETTMIYTHAMRRTGLGVRSPLDT